MKIAILSFYSGHHERGVENWTCELSSHLAVTHEVTVIQNAKAKETEDIYKVISANIPVNWNISDFRDSIFRKFFVDYWSILIGIFTIRLIPHLLFSKYDIIIPTNGGWQSAFVRLITWIKRKKMIIVGHSGPGWDDRNNLWCFPDYFVSLTKASAKWARRANPFVKIEVIPDGVNLKKFTPEGKKAEMNVKGPVVLVVGALEKSKRLNLTIEACSKIEGISLVVLGEGSQKEELSTLGENLLGERFMLTKVEHEFIPEYYRSASVFTLPSWENEAFGMVYLEAMACNLPVVATLDEARREIIGQAGILVDPKDIVSYTDALKKALNKDWEILPRSQAEMFSWEKVTNEYEDLFLQLVS